MADIKWVKITTDMFDNRKIKHIRRLPDGDRITLIWIMLLTVAGRSNMGGGLYLTQNIPYTLPMLADELGYEESTLTAALGTMAQLHMVAKEKGVYRIVGWEEYQNISRLAEIREYNRIAQQKSRANRKSVNDNVNDNVNDKSMTSQECQDIEEEEEEEKEYHSFFHSQKTDEEKYVEKKVWESGLEGKEADCYRKQVRENLKLKYLGGELGQYKIFISDEQFEDLCNRLSLDEMEKYFNIVADCEREGKRYKRKSHYQAIIEMATRDRALL